jgi:branched-chain amino acid transport system ATP-binding protein
LGKDITNLPLHHRANLGLSRTFQIIDLFKELTVLENVVLAVQSFKLLRRIIHRPLSCYKHPFYEAEKFLKQWDLWDKRDVKISSLSYGDQRLLDILLALANSPRFLLLDEPLAGLALAEVKAVTSRIKDLSQEVTIMLIEHNMDAALDFADRVTVLHMGQVLAEGTPDEIKQDPQVKKIYLRTKVE